MMTEPCDEETVQFQNDLYAFQRLYAPDRKAGQRGAVGVAAGHRSRARSGGLSKASRSKPSDSKTSSRIGASRMASADKTKGAKGAVDVTSTRPSAASERISSRPPRADGDATPTEVATGKTKPLKGDRSTTPSKASSTHSQAAASQTGSERGPSRISGQKQKTKGTAAAEDAASSADAELEEEEEADNISLDKSVVEEEADRWFEDLRASPLLAETLAGLPRAFVAYAEDDLLAVDATRFVDRLRADRGGHEAAHTLHLQGPLGHGFVKQPTQPEAHSAISAAAAFASAMLHAPPAA